MYVISFLLAASPLAAPPAESCATIFLAYTKQTAA
jgi:hypothetical protein